MSATPGGDTAVSSGACTDATPCFVCGIKAIVVTRLPGAKFSDLPFELNLIGCRQENSISDAFDDRLIAFFALPGGDAQAALEAGEVEKALIEAVEKGAKDANAAKNKVKGLGVRRVACSRIELKEGVKSAGHRVVAVFPISTDPGMVRTPKAEENLADCKQDLADLKKLKGEFEPLWANVKTTGDALKNIKPQPKNKKDKSEAFTNAENECKKAMDALKDFSAKVPPTVPGFKGRKIPPTLNDLAGLIKSAETSEAKAQKAYEAWKAPLTESEKSNFQVERAFLVDGVGWEGDNHALFPPGDHPKLFMMQLHHGSKDSAMPALTVGYFLGKRVISGKTVKAKFANLERWPRLNTREQLDPTKEIAELKVHDAAQKNDLAEFDKLNKARAAQKATKADVAAERSAREKQHADTRAAIQRKYAPRKLELSQEYVVLKSVRKAAGPTPPPGTWIVVGCQVMSTPPAPIADRDAYEIEGVTTGALSGRDVRMHFHALVGDKKKLEDGLTIVAHTPADHDAPVVPKGTKIVITEAKFEVGGALQPIGDDDIFEVEAMLGGTNMHRAHTIAVKDGADEATCDPNNEGSRVGNYSTGCQVFPFSPDFNLFIRLAALSKRYRCRASGEGKECALTKKGSRTAADPVVWTFTRTDSPVVPKDVSDKIKATVAKIQADIVAAQGEVKAAIDAWFKKQKNVKQPKIDAAEKLMAETLDRAIGDLNARLDPAGTMTDAQRAERTSTDAEWAKADASRQSLVADRQTLTTAVDHRAGALNRLALVNSVTLHIEPGMFTVQETDKDKKPLVNKKGQPVMKGFPLVYADMEACYKKLAPELDALVATFTDAAAAEAKTVAQDIRSSIDKSVEEMKKECFIKAAKMNHDYLRTCDLAWTCDERFDYTLIELKNTKTAARGDSIARIDDDFGRAQGDVEVHPAWSAFKSQ